MNMGALPGRVLNKAISYKPSREVYQALHMQNPFIRPPPVEKSTIQELYFVLLVMGSIKRALYVI